MLHSRLRFHQVDDQGPQQLCPHLLRRIPTYGPLQVCKTLHIIELFAFHALVRFRTHRKKRKSEIRRKKLEGGHVARLMHDERSLFQPELDGRAVGVGIEDIAKTRRSHIHFRRHCPDAAGILLHRRLYGFDNVFKCGDCHHFTVHPVCVPPYSGGHGTCSPAHHPARPRLARPHPVRRHHQLEVLPRRGLPHARSRGPAVRGGASHGQARK